MTVLAQPGPSEQRREADQSTQVVASSGLGGGSVQCPIWPMTWANVAGHSFRHRNAEALV